MDIISIVYTAFLGVGILVVIGICIQLRQQSAASKRENESSNKS